MVGRIEFASSRVSIDGIRDLIVAALVETAQVEPYFGDVRVDSDGTGISIECITELIDLEVEYSDGAPECGVASVAINGLLICLVCLVILLPSHVSTTEEIPALSIRRVWDKQ